MGRKQNDAEPGRYATLILLLIGVISCTLVYALATVAFGPGWDSSSSDPLKLTGEIGSGDNAEWGFGVESGECCRGIDNLELWGPAVKWGSDFKFNSSVECCRACKAMCGGNDGPCLCDTWVYCGNKEACGSKFGECWLKKQKDSLAPDRQEAGQTVIWTSGLVYGKGEGIIGLETEYGTMHIKLYPDCAPHSVSYILELLALRHCAGCQFHRAEGRGQFWDLQGNHVPNAPFGPPFALIQGTLEADGTPFRKAPKEACPTIKRGTVAWVGSGPEFFVSLVKHEEWRREYTAFGSVLPEDMSIAERIAELPTKPEVWNNINVSVLEKPVPLVLQRIKMRNGDIRGES